MGEITRYLSEDVGVRLAGTENSEKAASYIADYMKNLGLDVQRQKFNFMGWSLERNPTLKIHSPEEKEVLTVPFLWSGSTPEAGVSGELKYVGKTKVIDLFEWDKFVLIDGNGVTRGVVVARNDGPAIPQPLNDPRITYPSVIIGKDDLESIQSWINNGKSVKATLSIGTSFNPEAVTENVIGTVEGKRDEVILVTSHFDSMFDAQGACDNASGVEGVLRLAERFSKEKPEYTMKFITFGAEEWNLLGSRFYVQTLKESGKLSKVKRVLNLDMIGAGEYLWVWTTEELKKSVSESIDSLGISKEYKVEYTIPPLPGSDHYPFHLEGVSTTLLIWWPYEHYHLSRDTYDKINPKLIDLTVDLAEKIIKKWMEI